MFFSTHNSQCVHGNHFLRIYLLSVKTEKPFHVRYWISHQTSVTNNGFRGCTSVWHSGSMDQFGWCWCCFFFFFRSLYTNTIIIIDNNSSFAVLILSRRFTDFVTFCMRVWNHSMSWTAFRYLNVYEFYGWVYQIILNVFSASASLPLPPHRRE